MEWNFVAEKTLSGVSPVFIPKYPLETNISIKLRSYGNFLKSMKYR